MKISEKKISFFSTLNQYFPHIPYVASKNIIFLDTKQIFPLYSICGKYKSFNFGYLYALATRPYSYFENSLRNTMKKVIHEADYQSAKVLFL
jgi:hypothetical protein